jgi:hypothetical protein
MSYLPPEGEQPPTVPAHRLPAHYSQEGIRPQLSRVTVLAVPVRLAGMPKQFQPDPARLAA